MSADPSNYPKKPYKKKPRTRPLPKAKQSYLEAEETLFQQLEEHAVGYERKFQPLHTKNWRFDFHIVRLKLLIEIAGSPWSVGRGGKKIANSFNKYELAEDLGYTTIRFDPPTIESGQVINWIQNQLARLEDGQAIQTIPTD